MTDKKLLQIMLIEDNDGDVFLTKKAFQDSGVQHEFYHADNGETALNMLWKDKSYKDIPRPDIILLDINLPGKNGFEILKEIKNDERLRRIPVILLTSSQAETDVVQAYNMRGNSYITKPQHISEYKNIALAIKNFWFETAKLPH